jgi:transcriptional regulator with XRE-family HTH domain
MSSGRRQKAAVRYVSELVPMAVRKSSSPQHSPVGTLLQHWRRVRSKSQLALAFDAEVSARHVCFIETGRAKPSRDMVLILAEALEVPLRERNLLLLAAGYAPLYREATLDSPELGAARTALEAILRQQETFPAVVMNRRWDILAQNSGASRFFTHLLDGNGPDGPANVARLMFDPGGLRPFVANWAAVAEALMHRIHREAVGGAPDEWTNQLLDELRAYPDVPRRWHALSAEEPLLPVIPVTFEKHGKTYSFFSTVTTLGTPLDVTLQELRIECFFPLDDETRRHVVELQDRSGAE